MCQNSLPSGGGGSVSAKISEGRGHHSQGNCIVLQLCRGQFLYNETLQQTSRPLLSKLV